MAQKLKVNDLVTIIAGDNKGRTAKIVRIDRENGRAELEGIGERERHMRKSYLNPTGGKKTVRTGIALSNLKLEQSAKYEKPKAEKATKAKSAKKAKAEKKVKKGAK